MFTGAMVAIVTPMLPGGEVDDAGLSRLVEFQLEAGTEAIVSVGTTGESATLTMAENVQVIRRTVELVAGRVPVIAGTGANATAEAIELARGAAAAGADATLSVVPYYNKPSQAGMAAHFRAVADAVDIPMYLYNVPGRTVVDMAPQTTAALSAHPRIVGIKDAAGGAERTRALRAQCAAGFVVLSGEDATCCESLLAGGDGFISVTANVAPRQMRALCDAARGGEVAQARQLDRVLAPVHEAMFVEPSPVAAKWALEQMGLIHDTVRLPMLPLSEPHRETVAAQLLAAGVLQRTGEEA